MAKHPLSTSHEPGTPLNALYMEMLTTALLSGCYYHTHSQKRNLRLFVSNLIKIIQVNEEKRQNLKRFPFLKLSR